LKNILEIETDYTIDKFEERFFGQDECVFKKCCEKYKKKKKYCKKCPKK